MDAGLTREDVLEELKRCGGSGLQDGGLEEVEDLTSCASKRPLLLTRQALEHLALRPRAGAERFANATSSGGGDGGGGGGSSSSRRSLGGFTADSDDASASVASTPRLFEPSIDERLLRLFLDGVRSPPGPEEDPATVTEAAEPPSAAEEVPAAVEADESIGAAEPSAHETLQELHVDPRLLHPLLFPLSKSNPAMYQSLLGHTFIVGKVASKVARRKRKKVRNSKPDAAGSQGSAEDEMDDRRQGRLLQPDFTSGALPVAQMRVQLAIFIAKAMRVDCSLQAAMIAAKLLIAVLTHRGILQPTSSDPLAPPVVDPVVVGDDDINAGCATNIEGNDGADGGGGEGDVGEMDLEEEEEEEEEEDEQVAAAAVTAVAAGAVAGTGGEGQFQKPVRSSSSDGDENADAVHRSTADPANAGYDAIVTLPLGPVLVAVLRKWNISCPFGPYVTDPEDDPSKDTGVVASSAESKEGQRHKRQASARKGAGGGTNMEAQEQGGAGSSGDRDGRGGGIVDGDEKTSPENATRISIGEKDSPGGLLKGNDESRRGEKFAGAEPASADAMLNLLTEFDGQIGHSGDGGKDTNENSIEVSVEVVLLVLFLHIDKLSLNQVEEASRALSGSACETPRSLKRTGISSSSSSSLLSTPRGSSLAAAGRSGRGTSGIAASTQPHPLTFLLLHSLLSDIDSRVRLNEEAVAASYSSGSNDSNDPLDDTPVIIDPASDESFHGGLDHVQISGREAYLAKTGKKIDDLDFATLRQSKQAEELENEERRKILQMQLFNSFLSVTVLRALAANVRHISVAGVSPGSVGLGQTQTSRIPGTANMSLEGGGEPEKGTAPILFVNRLRVTVDRFVHGVADSLSVADEAESDIVAAPELVSSVRQYQIIVRDQSLDLWAVCVQYFYPTHLERFTLLQSLLDEKRSMITEQSPPEPFDDQMKTVEGGVATNTLDDITLVMEKLIRLLLCLAGEDLAIYFTRSNHTSLTPGALNSSARVDAYGAPALSMLSKDDVMTHLRALLPSGDSGGGEDEAEAESQRQTLEQMYQAFMAGTIEGGGSSAGDDIALTLHDTSSRRGIENSGSETPSIPITAFLRTLVNDVKSGAPLPPSMLALQYLEEKLSDAKVALLHGIQLQMNEKLLSSADGESGVHSLEFNPKRCNSTIELSEGNRIATQRQSKSWGSVMTKSGCEPGSGVHQWIVRLNRCEKGHVFLGVCTGDASCGTYVGGDRFGWGMIGTKALWHNKAKVRGDYSDGYGTGSCIRVQLDMDQGTLAFGIVGGADWGLAFEGLPTNEALYPAVGLYQRDDQVTILHSLRTSSDASAVGNASFAAIAAPPSTKPQHTAELMELFLYASDLMEAGSDILAKAEHLFNAHDEGSLPRVMADIDLILGHSILLELLPGLLAALCLMRRVPHESVILSLRLLPALTLLLKQLDNAIAHRSRTRKMQTQALDLITLGDISGQWHIQSAAANNIPAQEYFLELNVTGFRSIGNPRCGSDGKGVEMRGTICTDFSGHGIDGVSGPKSVSGCVVGSHVQFLEAWLQGGTCTIEGRLGLDGDFFTGMFQDTKSGTSGLITGHRISGPHILKDSEFDVLTKLKRTQMVLASFAGKLATNMIAAGCDGVLPTIVFSKPSSPPSSPLSPSSMASPLIMTPSPLNATDDAQQPSMTPASADGLETSALQDTDGDKLKNADAVGGDEARSTIPKLLRSRLFAGGLPCFTCLDAIRHVVPMSLQPSSNDGSSSWWYELVFGGGGTQDEDGCAPGANVIHPFVEDIVKGGLRAQTFDVWILRFTGVSFSLRLGGECMQRARRYILAVILLHSRCADLAEETFEAMSKSHGSNGEAWSCPADSLLQVWRGAQRVVEIMIRRKQEEGISYSVLADGIEDKAQLLMRVQPYLDATKFSLPLDDGYASLQNDMIAEVVQFFESGVVDVTALEVGLKHAAGRGALRAGGLKALALIIGPTNETLISNADFAKSAPAELLLLLRRNLPQSLRTSSALASVIQSLAPSLYGFEDPITIAGQGIVPCLYSLHAAETKFCASESIGAGHYLDGVHGCGRLMAQRIHTAFHLLYGHMATLQRRAVSSQDLDLQLVLLQAWGVPMSPKDHIFLSDISIFSLIKETLEALKAECVAIDCGRDQIGDSIMEALASKKKEQRDPNVGASKAYGIAQVHVAQELTMRATLKLLHLLAAEVAHSGSGTLGPALFDMLYAELAATLEQLDDGHNQGRATGADFKWNSAAYCDQILGLLSSVSRSSECQRLLTTSRWLELLLLAVPKSSPMAQRTILRVLRFLLPAADPESRELVGCTLTQASEAGAQSSGAEGILWYLLNVAASSMVYASPAVRYRRRSPHDVAVRKWVPKSDFSLTDEALAVLRCLAGSSSWAIILNDVLKVAFSYNFTEQSEKENSQPIYIKQQHYLAAVAMVGGHINGVYIGGLVKLRSNGARVSGGHGSDVSGLSADSHSTTASQPCGVVIATDGVDGAQRTAEVIFLEARQDFKLEKCLGDVLPLTTLSIPNSLGPVRTMKILLDYVMPVAEVDADLGGLDEALNDIFMGNIETVAFQWFWKHVGGDSSCPQPHDESKVEDSNKMKGSTDNEEKDDMASPRLRGFAESHVAAKVNEFSLIEATAAVATMRASWAFLNHERFIRKFLKDTREPQSPVNRTAATRLRYLLEVAITPTATGGVCPDLEKVEELWLSLWAEWNEHTRRIIIFEADEMARNARSSASEALETHGAIDTASVASDISSIGGGESQGGQSALNQRLEGAIGISSEMAALKKDQEAEEEQNGASLSLAPPANSDTKGLEETVLTSGAAQHSPSVAGIDGELEREEELAEEEKEEEEEGFDHEGEREEDQEALSATAGAAESNNLIVHMTEMGFQKEWCEVALHRCNGNLEQAVNFCFEHGDDMEAIMAEERAIASVAAAAAAAAARAGTSSASDRQTTESIRRTFETTIYMKQLLEMGFPPNWCSKALSANQNNVDAALTWILSNGESLAAQDQEEAQSRDENDDDEDEEIQTVDDDLASQGPGGSRNDGAVDGIDGDEADNLTTASQYMDQGTCPLLAVSGHAEISDDLTVKGVAGGGFASVGCRGCVITKGKWFYEVKLKTAGCMQIGWCDAAYKGHAENGEGVGDGPHSWAYDGWRCRTWHDGHAEWGARWARGDVLAVGADLDNRSITFVLNGRGKEISMGEAFSNISFAGGLYPCASFNQRERLTFNFGGRPFLHGPQTCLALEGYRPYAEVFAMAAAHPRLHCFHLPRDSTLYVNVAAAAAKAAASAASATCGGGHVSLANHGDDVELVDGDEIADGLTTHSADGANSRRRMIGPGRRSSPVLASEESMEEDVAGQIFHHQNRFFPSDESGRQNLDLAGYSGRGLSQNARFVEPSAIGPGVDDHDVDGASLGVPEDGERYLHRLKELQDDTMRRIQDVACDLCILYSRRCALAIFAGWPMLGDTSISPFHLGMLNAAKVRPTQGTPLENSHVENNGDQHGLGSGHWSVTWKHCDGSIVFLQFLKVLTMLSPAAHVFPSIYPPSPAFSGSNSNSTFVEAPQFPLFIAGDALWRKSTLEIISPAIRLALSASPSDANTSTVHSEDVTSSLPSLCFTLAAFVAELLTSSSTRGFAAFWHRASETRGPSAASSTAWTKAMGLSTLLNMADDYTTPTVPGAASDPTSTDHLNPSLATWLTGLLLSSLLPSQSHPSEEGAALPRAIRFAVVEHILQSWARALQSPSAPLKFVSAAIISAIMQRGIVESDAIVDSYPVAPRTVLTQLHPNKERNSDLVRRVYAHTLRWVWKETPAFPIASRYLQALVELTATLQRAFSTEDEGSIIALDTDGLNNANPAIPKALPTHRLLSGGDGLPCSQEHWEGAIISDDGWEIWSGVAVQHEIRWRKPKEKRPPLSGLSIGERGCDEPMSLLPGHYVRRNPCATQASNLSLDPVQSSNGSVSSSRSVGDDGDGENMSACLDTAARATAADDTSMVDLPSTNTNTAGAARRLKVFFAEKNPSMLKDVESMLALHAGEEDVMFAELEKKYGPPGKPSSDVGIVEEIIPWKGVPGAGRRVRWDRGEGAAEDVRWGYGGEFDVLHVELSKDKTKVRKTYPTPTTREHMASRRGFGSSARFGMLLRLRRRDCGNSRQRSGDSSNDPEQIDGILEWPDFCAKSYVVGERWCDGSLRVTEMRLLTGTAHSGWVQRFATEHWQPGTEYTFAPSGAPPEDLAETEHGTIGCSILPRKLVGSFSYSVRIGAEDVSVLGDVALQSDTLFTLDPYTCAQSITVSEDGCFATGNSANYRGLVFGTVGFSSGVHYWEIKVEQADLGSIFLGVAEKLGVPGDEKCMPRVTRWQGWGFVNYRAVRNKEHERVYGEHFHANDTVGIRLDMDRGRISFFLDGMKYGEHIVSDLGPAYGTDSQGGSLVTNRLRLRQRTLWPVIGMGETRQGDRVAITKKWLSSNYVHPADRLRNVIAASTLLHAWENTVVPSPPKDSGNQGTLPTWIYREGWIWWQRWRSARWHRCATRASASADDTTTPARLDLDVLPLACVIASVKLGLRRPLFSGDRVLVKRAGGKVLDQPEEAVVLGAHRGVLWYHIDSQKGEAATLEGASRPWCWMPSDIEDFDIISESPCIPPTIRSLVVSTRLGCTKDFRGGLLRTVYPDGAIIRDGLEIDCSDEIGRLEIGTVVYASERRVNSCDIARFFIEYELPSSQGGETIRGWVSERIRGGDGALIMGRLESEDPSRPREASGANAQTSPTEDAASKRATVDDDAKEDKACDEEHVSGGDIIRIIVHRWMCRLKRAAQWALAEDTEKITSDTPRCAATTANATLNAWLDPSFRDDAEEMAPHKDFGTFYRLATRNREIIAEGTPDTTGPWDAESDMQLAEVLQEWCGILGIADFHNLPFWGLRAMLQSAASAASSSTVESSGTVLLEKDALLYRALAKKTKLRFIDANNAQSQNVLPAKSGLQPDPSAADEILARAAIILTLNNRMHSALPFMSLSLPEEEWEDSLGPGSASPISIPLQAPGLTTRRFSATWQPLCTARRLRSLRRLLLTSTKGIFWESILTATTTPTALHHDEYEDSREIRTIKINRVRATPQRLASSKTNAERLRCSVFGQLHREMKSMSPAVFRRAYLGKGHGGQRRAFKVKFLGEGVDDYGGPYRAVFDQVVEELQGDSIAVKRGNPRAESAGSSSMKVAPGRCILPVLIPTPNRANSVATNQEKFVLAPGPASSLHLELASFLGKMIGMSMRHGLKMGLDLPDVIWNPLVGEGVSLSQLEQVDAMASRLLQRIAKGASASALDDANTHHIEGEGAGDVIDTWESWMEELTLATHLSDGMQVPLVPGGAQTLLKDSKERAHSSPWWTYIMSVASTRLRESLPMMQSLFTGLSAVLPTELFPLFTPSELERLVCGVRDVDLDLLKRCTEYEDVKPEAPHIVAFWEVLEEWQHEERAQFLKFVWARSRLPILASDFPMNFKLQGAQGGAKENPDDWLPHAQTCFFSLSLPEYSTKDILREKLLFAIKNSPNMDADVRLHEAEGWAGLG